MAAKQPWYKRVFASREQKSITAIQTLLLRNVASWSARNFVAFATEGFQQNPTVRSCVGKVQDAVVTCPIVMRNPDGSVIEKHPLLDLLNKPNPAQSREEFLADMVGYRLISGEADVWGNRGGTKVQELWVLRPDWLEPNIAGGVLNNWRYTPITNDARRAAPSTLDAGDVLVWKTFNPFDVWRGFSPLWSAAFAIDTLNEYAKANKALLDNDMRPSGILTTDQQLADASFKRLKAEMADAYAGAENNRKLMVTEGGLKYQQLGLSPRDMEFITGKLTNEQDVCKVLGVPGQLIGLSGSQTFANYEQARASFYEDTVIPLTNSALSSIVRWLGPSFQLKPGVTLEVDIEAVAALEPRRAERNKTLDAMSSISINEKRQAMGWDDVDNGDVVLVQSSMIPLDLAGADVLTTDPGATADNAYGKPAPKPEPAPTPSSQPIAAGADVQAQALNGAQMASLQAIAQAVADDELPAETAIALIMISIPTITQAQASALITPAAEFEPKPKPTPPAVGAPPVVPAKPDLTPQDDADPVPPA